ncbi:MAG: hypothetical protein M1814_006864 [Vezdaea aestivalis]|nr:MAG: hypothetical protein M1814_006864 [Vezdaea aestivalis]
MKLLPIALTAVACASAQDSNATAPFPNTTYPDAVADYAVPGAQSGQSSPPFYPSPWGRGQGEWAVPYEKARKFVSQLTLLEKVNITTGVGWQQERCVGQVGSVPRLGFRSLCMQDSPLGVRIADFVSTFPAGLSAAATWNRDLMYQRGYAMGSEHRDKGVDVQLGPVAGPLGRSPEGGRNWEGFSPDPYLTGVAMAQTVRGIQDAGVIACSKHFIGNEQEHFRQAPESKGFGDNITESLSSNIDDRTMHELYLWPFADAVRAGTGSIMCSYNQINNSYGCQNSHALNYLLKNELAFDGFIMSDWQAHHSGVGAALAGLDMSMPGDTLFGEGRSFWGANLTLAVANGSVPEWRVDDMVTRIVAAWYKVGRDTKAVPINFDSWTTDTFGNQHFLVGQGYGLVNEHRDVRAEHANLIRNIGSNAIVLLKNNNSALPLQNQKLTAVIGQGARDSPWGPNGESDRGGDNGTLAQGWGSGTADFPYLVSPLTAITNEVLSRKGSVLSVTDNGANTQIQALARRASVSLVFVTSDSGEGYISVDGNEGDRQNLTLWHQGEDIVNNVSSQCDNTIVVISSTGPVLVGSFKDNPNVTAILWAALPGQEAGNSIADVLYGRVNPGGKSPFTWGSKRSDWGTDILYEPKSLFPQANFQEGIFIDYRSFDKRNITPAYPFGFGLSYTTFNYSGLAVTKTNAGPYVPSGGMTSAAPSTGNSSYNLGDYQFPSNFTRIPKYIYPYLNTTNASFSSDTAEYGTNSSAYIPNGALDGTPQPIPVAGGSYGGNAGLYDILYQVTATITNTGKVAGDEVVQLYVSLGGPEDAKVVLRGFDRLRIAAGGSATFHADLTRRDVSSWDTVSQNWVVTNATKTVHVGASSRDLPLMQVLA